jgi:hypothetical protein
MPARRAAGGPDAVRVNTEPSGVGPEEADCGFGVFHRRRELILGAQAIVDGGCDVAVLRQIVGDGAVALPRAGAKAAAVDAHDRRKGAGAGLGAGHVEQLFAPDRGVLDSLFEEDVARGVLGESGGGEKQSEQAGTHGRILAQLATHGGSALWTEPRP